MYIPTQFYGQLNSCISASGGDEVDVFISGSIIYKFHKYTTLGSGSFTIHSGSTADARIFLVGGGGGGGRSSTGAQGAGGGGAGGLLLNQSQLGPGTYTLYVGDGGATTVSGEDTWFQRTPISLNQITAEGGGAGAWLAGSTPSIRAGQGGGSGGGAARGLVPAGRFTAPAGGGITPQGFGGGTVLDTFIEQGAGGGGASQAGINVITDSPAGRITRGGNGLEVNVDGTFRYYAGGGGGQGEGLQWDSTTSLGSNYYGGGGSGSNDDIGGNPSPANASDGHPKIEGRQGIAVVMYPLCTEDLSECTTYNVNGGQLGGTISYIPCNSASIETFSLDPLDRVTICSLPITIGTNQYPQKTGTVTFTASGSCDTYIPPVNPPSCPTGSDLVELNSTRITVVNATYCFNALDYQLQPISFCRSSGTTEVCIQSSSLQAVTVIGIGSYSASYTDTLCSYTCQVTGSVDVTPAYSVNVVLAPQNMNSYVTSSQITMDWVNDGVTLEIWAQSTAETNGSLRSFINLHDNNAGGNLQYIEIPYIDTNPTSGLLDAYVYANYYTGTGNISTSLGTILNNSWNHHVLTWNKSFEQMSYYRNGALISSVNLSSVSSDLTNPYLNVGINAQNASTLQGYYGEYRVYPFALNSTQVLYNYNNTKQRYQL